MSKTNTEIVTEFIQTWSSLDADRLAEFFTEDGCYHNMPTQPIRGRDAVRSFIAQFLSTWTETKWEILHIAEQDDLVFCERMDRTKTTRGDVDLPCNGVFQMQDGKIKEWRDYFDLGTFMNAMS